MIELKNKAACLNPPKYWKNECKSCHLFKTCPYELKILGFKGGVAQYQKAAPVSSPPSNSIGGGK